MGIDNRKYVTNLVSIFIESYVTKNDTKKVIRKRTAPVTVIRNLIIGENNITPDFLSNKAVIISYNISE